MGVFTFGYFNFLILSFFFAWSVHIAVLKDEIINWALFFSYNASIFLTKVYMWNVSGKYFLFYFTSFSNVPLIYHAEEGFRCFFLDG